MVTIVFLYGIFVLVTQQKNASGYGGGHALACKRKTNIVAQEYSKQKEDK